MPLLWLSIAFISGVLLGQALDLSPRLWLGLALSAAAGLGIILRWGSAGRSKILRWLVLGLCLLSLGGARAQAHKPQFSQQTLASYNDQEPVWVLAGWVVAPPDQRDTNTLLTVQIERLKAAGAEAFQPVEGRLLVRRPREEQWEYGQRLELTGKLQTPPEDEDFSYRAYLGRRAIYSYLPYGSARPLPGQNGSRFLRSLYAFKDRALASVYRSFPDPEASLLAGILLGVDNGLPETVTDAFRETGAAHIIAISGYNLTLIAGMFSLLFTRWLGKRRGALAAGAGVLLYTLLVGPEPAVARAAIMAALGLLAGQLGRPQNALNSLAFSAALLTLFEPDSPAEVGFQLSFLATLGLVLYAGPLQDWLQRLLMRHLPAEQARRLAGPLGEYFLVTLAAQITTLPVMLLHFGRISLSSLLVNPLILPVQPAVMVLGGLAVIAGLVWAPLGQGLAWLAWPALRYTIGMVELLAKLPGGEWVTGPVSAGWIITLYPLILAPGLERLLAPWLPEWLRLSHLRQVVQDRLGIGPDQPQNIALRLALPGLVGLALLNSLVWQAAFTAPDGHLHLTVLGVSSGGQAGEALLIQTPGGRQVLVNGGPSPRQLSDALGRRLPLGRRKLDWLVIAGTANEQLAGLPDTIERFPPAQVLWAGEFKSSQRGARATQRALQAADIPITIAETGQVLDLGQGARLEVLAVGQAGAVLRLEWKNFRVLLPAGLDEDLLDANAVSPDGPLTALLLPGGGKAGLNPPEWLQGWQPGLVLLSAVPGDCPPETLDALQGVPVLRTDQNGWIELTTDGEQMWVEVERNTP